MHYHYYNPLMEILYTVCTIANKFIVIKCCNTMRFNLTHHNKQNLTVNFPSSLPYTINAINTENSNDPKVLLGTFYELADFRKWNKSKNLGKTAKEA